MEAIIKCWTTSEMFVLAVYVFNMIIRLYAEEASYTIIYVRIDIVCHSLFIRIIFECKKSV